MLKRLSYSRQFRYIQNAYISIQTTLQNKVILRDNKMTVVLRGSSYREHIDQRMLNVLYGNQLQSSALNSTSKYLQESQFTFEFTHFYVRLPWLPCVNCWIVILRGKDISNVVA